MKTFLYSTYLRPLRTCMYVFHTWSFANSLTTLFSVTEKMVQNNFPTEQGSSSPNSQQTFSTAWHLFTSSQRSKKPFPQGLTYANCLMRGRGSTHIHKQLFRFSSCYLCEIVFVWNIFKIQILPHCIASINTVFVDLFSPLSGNSESNLES